MSTFQTLAISTFKRGKPSLKSRINGVQQRRRLSQTSMWRLNFWMSDVSNVGNIDVSNVRCFKRYLYELTPFLVLKLLTREPLVLPHSDFYETYLKKSGKNSILRICIWFNTPIFLSRDIEVKSCKKIHYNFVQKVIDPCGIRTRLIEATNWAKEANR